MNTRTPRLAVLLFPCLLLAACGGGGGGNPPGGNNPPENQAPTVAIDEIDAVMELTTVTLAATAQDPDGDALSYTWAQTAGTPVELANADSAAVSFAAPKVTNSETLQFRVTPTDGEGASATATTGVTVTEAEGVVFAVAEMESEVEFDMALYYRHPGLPEPILIHAAEPNHRIFDLAVSPDRRRVAFREADDEGVDDAVFVAALDGSGGHDLTQDMANPDVDVSAVLAWMSDSSGVVFLADGQHANVYELYFGPIHSNEATRRISGEIFDNSNNETGDPVPDGIPDGSVVDFSVAPQGPYVAFRGQMNGDVNEIFVTTPEGDVHRVSPVGDDPDEDGLPAKSFRGPGWSFDGSRLAFTGDPDGRHEFVYLANPDSPDATTNATGSFSVITAFTSSLMWSPVDNHLMFHGTLRASQGRELFVIDAGADDPAASRQLVSGDIPAGSFVYSAQWAPNGEMASFAVSGEENLYVVSLDAPGVRFTVSGDIVENGDLLLSDEILWSPDSTHIAFRGDLHTDNESELYVTAISNPATRKTAFDYRDGNACYIEERDIRWNTGSTHLLSRCVPETGALKHYLRAFPVAATNPSASMINVSGPGIDTDGDGTGDASIREFVDRPSGDGVVFTAQSLDSTDPDLHLFEATIEEAGAPRAMLPSVNVDNFVGFVVIGPDGIAYSKR